MPVMYCVIQQVNDGILAYQPALEGISNKIYYIGSKIEEFAYKAKVCMYVCMYVYMYVCVCMYLCVCLCPYMFVYMCSACVDVWVHKCTGVCVCVHIYLHVLYQYFCTLAS